MVMMVMGEMVMVMVMRVCGDGFWCDELLRGLCEMCCVMWWWMWIVMWCLCCFARGRGGRRESDGDANANARRWREGRNILRWIWRLGLNYLMRSI